jgi:hypothetical protein
MRRYSSVDSVTTALLGALGLLGACGGSVTVVQGTPGGEDAGHDSPVGTPPGDDGGITPVPVPLPSPPDPMPPASCSKHPCTSPTPVVVGGVDTGFDTCSDGTTRRRAIVTCPTLLPRSGGGSCSAPDSGAFMNCTKDSDCADAPNGHCEVNNPGAGFGLEQCLCNFGCRSDSDCGSGEICLCGNPVGKCVLSECSSGSGCLPGCDCASPQTFGSFACQTPEDTCYSDQDCIGAKSSWKGSSTSMGSCFANGPLLCAPQTYAQNWTQAAPPGLTCQPGITCVTGRPFLVDGAERLAGCIVRPDWQASLSPDLTSPTESQRFRAATYWARVGAMEHASIAAFARFTLHLLSLGAPSELITLSQQAMGDETEHARLAYALASSYADLPLGPAALAIDGALDGSTTDEIIATLIREGCIGETLAAIEARDALDYPLDPAVRTVLEVIARDELRHAELAWKTLAWLLDSGRASRGAVRDEVTRALHDMAATPVPSGPGDEEDLSSFGVLSAARRAGLREQAGKVVVTRCIDQLVGRARTPQPPATSRAA